jgi:RNA polymerase sigma-70 factor, ECF subfamily
MPDEEHETGDDLIARIAAGDRDAFAALYRRHRAHVYRFAAHMSGSPTMAEDVVQDVFVAIIEQASRYRTGRSGVVPWLLGIARNHVRRWRSQPAPLPLPPEDSDACRALAVKADPLDAVMRRDHTSALRRALLDLPVVYREAVVLCDLQELSYAEAAEALGCALGTVRSRLHRGRALLGKRMSESSGHVMCRVPATRPIT